MVTDTTASALARDLIVYREMLSVALERLAVAQRQMAQRDELIEMLREDLRRFTREAVQA